MTGTLQWCGVPIGVVLVDDMHNTGLKIFIVGFSQPVFISHTITRLHGCRKVSFKQFWKRNKSHLLSRVQIKQFDIFSDMKRAVKVFNVVINAFYLNAKHLHITLSKFF